MLVIDIPGEPITRLEKLQLIDQRLNLNDPSPASGSLREAWIVSWAFQGEIPQLQVFMFVLALSGVIPEDEYNEANKRHTMSHPPDHIPDMDNQTPAKIKSPKERKEKEKVI